jgi:hypothetical protein
MQGGGTLVKQAVTMTFDNWHNRVRIQKSTLNALGNPTFIRALYNQRERVFVLEPVTMQEAHENGYSLWDLMRIPNEVYAKSRPYEYQNQNIMPLMRSFTKWHTFAQYRVRGTIENGIAVLDLDDYDIIMQGKPLRIVEKSQ